jgi:predicted kinase
MQHTATLHMVCGKIAAGKSTLCAKLANTPHTVLISQDFWLARLYPKELNSLQDYVRCASRLREALSPHLVALLLADVSVVLDFPANTIATRQWMRGIFQDAKAPHKLHYIEVPDVVCKERLRQRNAAGSHDYITSEAEFDLFTSYFIPPDVAEGFEVILYQR